MDSEPPPRTASSSNPLLEASAADPGDDPFSSGPLQAGGATLIGALIALLAVVLPIASVLGDRHDPSGGATTSPPTVPAAVSARSPDGGQVP